MKPHMFMMVQVYRNVITVRLSLIIYTNNKLCYTKSFASICIVFTRHFMQNKHQTYQAEETSLFM